MAKTGEQSRRIALSWALHVVVSGATVYRQLWRWAFQRMLVRSSTEMSGNPVRGAEPLMQRDEFPEVESRWEPSLPTAQLEAHLPRIFNHESPLVGH